MLKITFLRFLKYKGTYYVLTIPCGVAEEVISTASIVYKYHQSYGNATDKTRKDKMQKFFAR